VEAWTLDIAVCNYLNVHALSIQLSFGSMPQRVTISQAGWNGGHQELKLVCMHS
jgi:hypothetical protein